MDGNLLFLVIIYVILTTFSFIAVFMYHYAYVNMKRSHVILSVLWLLFTILINIKFFLYTIDI